MSYQVLARKWRPLTFDEVTGQSHVTTPLRNAIRTGRIPHAILLTGPRGTGKTTLARIFASCLNAEKGPTDAPDPDDPAVAAIQSGSSTDVQEVDAASRTSVDDVREIIDSIRYAAAPGKHRIFIVDEVHMLSTPAFNALLKTLEEPPPQSLFLFCTTNPEKIPFTVLSRCQRYDLRRIATVEVAARLGEIAKSEKIEISKPSLLAVARAGDGSMRDSLTLLDQLVAFGGGKVDDEKVAEVLDLIDRTVLVAIIAACIDGDAAGALRSARSAFDTGADAKRLGAALVGVLRDLVVLRVAPEAGLVEGADAELEALHELAARSEEPRLRRMFRALVREQEDLAWAPDPFAVIEMALVRLAGMPSGDQVEALLARIDALERRLGEAGGGAGGPGTGGPGRARSGPASGRASTRSSGGQKTAPAAAPQPLSAEAAAPEEPPLGEPPPEPTRAVVEPPPEPTRAVGEPPPEPTRAVVEPPPERTRAVVRPIDERTRGVVHPMDEPTRGVADPMDEPTRAVTDPMNDSMPARPPANGDASAAPPSLPPIGAPLPQVFDRLRAFAQDQNRGLFAALEGGVLLEKSERGLRISLPSSIALRQLERRLPELEATCESFFGSRQEVRLVDANAARDPGTSRKGPSPDDAKALARRRRQEALQHPAVNDALEILGAEILEIRPLGEAGDAR